jgi:hypothetical protein
VLPIAEDEVTPAIRAAGTNSRAGTARTWVAAYATGTDIAAYATGANIAARATAANIAARATGANAVATRGVTAAG